MQENQDTRLHERVQALETNMLRLIGPDGTKGTIHEINLNLTKLDKKINLLIWTLGFMTVVSGVKLEMIIEIFKLLK